jgi:hypothetical protein
MDLMIDAPSHDDVVKLWSATVKVAGGEPGIVVLPAAQKDSVIVAGFHPVEEIPLVEAVVLIVEGVHERLVRPCRWMAMAMPGYTHEAEADGTMPLHGDLQRRYKEGDESVREALSVLVTTYGPESTVMMRTYVQPLLEAEAEAGQADDDGPMAFALRMGLLTANMDPLG